ncbi:MAG: gluconeogenesis factor YvcK family protein [Bacillota bacterium]|nr:gluconeogenesis factor YvcK family protein [Bacillota bacterium]
MEDAKIVVIGGGTGLSIILRGLKKISSSITAIVTVADDGGGSGVLREDLGMLPPGDIRACLIALSDVEPILEELFNYRFENGNLKGQSFGNLMIAAMVGISKDFNDAVLKVGEIIAINGRVLPVTIENVHLMAKLENGLYVKGESKIPYEVLKNKSRIESIDIIPGRPDPTVGVLEAIEEADLIIVGPGSLYTSIIPNLLVNNMADTIKRSRGKVAYISNLMTQPGESDNYSLSEHLKVIEEHIGENIFDYVLANNVNLDKETKEKYKFEKSMQVKIESKDRQFLSKREIELIEGKYFEIVKHYCRHDVEILADVIQKNILQYL